MTTPVAKRSLTSARASREGRRRSILRRATRTSLGRVAWYATQVALVDGLTFGLALAFPVAFVVLCFATSNLVLAFYAMVTIGLIVASVLGTVPRRRPHCYFFDRLAQRQRVRFQS